MNKAIVLVAVAIVAAAGISAFALMSSDSGEVTPIVQEPIAEKPAVVEEEVSILDTKSFPAPTTIAQSMMAAQPAPNVTIGDDGKIYVLYLSLIHI